MAETWPAPGILAGALILLLLCAGLRRGLYRLGLGTAALCLMNLAAPFLGAHLGINALTLLLSGALGLPGVLLLLLLSRILAV